MSGDALLQPAHRRFVLLFGPLVVGAIGVVALMVSGPTPPLRASRASLLRWSNPDARSIEPRVSGLPWAPYRPPQGKPAPSDGKRGAASVAAQHEKALYELLAEEPRQALATLEAASRSSNDASVWSDLAVAYHETAIRFDAPELLADALAAADRALSIDPRYLEALFNRALMIEKLALPDDARAAWRAYLDVDSTSGWGEDAQRHLDTLKRTSFLETLRRELDRVANDPRAAEELVARDAFGARGLTIAFVLGDWGTAWLCGDDADADRHLRAARNVAGPVSRNGDRMLERAIAAIDSADPATRRLLANAHVLYRDGCRIFTASRPIEAEPLFRQAAANFEQGRSSMVLPALYFAANTTFEQLHHDDAERQLEGLRATASTDFPAYRAFVLWQLGVCYSARANWGPAIEIYGQSIELFERVREYGNAACVRRLLAVVYDRIGDRRTAWRHRAASPHTLGAQSDLAHEKTNASIADAAIVRGEWRVAASFLTLHRDLARRTNNDYMLANTLFMRAVVRDRMGDDSGAGADLGAARTVAARVDDSTRREALDVADRRAEAMFASTSPARAEALLTEAIEFQATRSDSRNVPGLLVQRARVRRVAGNARGAMGDVQRGIAELERQRESLPEGEARWGAFHAAEELFDVAVDLAIDAGDAEGAFRFAEQARARALLESYGRSPRLDPRRLPPQTTVVEYVALPAHLVIFAVDASGVRAASVASTRESLSKDIDAFIERIADDDPSWKESASALYRTLIAPIASHIGNAGTLVIVPEALTSRVSFAALIDPRGAYLLQRHRIVFAPSAAAIAAIAERRGGVRRPESALLLTSASPAAGMSALAWVDEESRRIAALYPSAMRVAEDGDQFEKLRSRAPAADVIHFGGHGVGDERGLEPASIVMRQNGRERRVGVAEITKLRLRPNATVVIAGCSTARGERRAAEGVISVAHGFLSAGAPSVISTLWPIDDSHAAVFFPRLHRHLASGLAPAAAVQAAQLECIRKGDVPASLWAAVQDIGN